MTESVNWTVSVAVAGGPKVSGSNTIEVSAYDKLGVVVKVGSQAEVEVQPGEEGQVRLLLISSDQYGTDLTYRVNDENGDAIALDALQLFIGDGAVSLLDQPPQAFFFDNQMDVDAAIEILVARKATTGEEEPADGTTDGSTDGGTDSGSDTGSTDSSTDSGTDSGSTDSGGDTGSTDSSTDSGTDAGSTDSSGDTGSTDSSTDTVAQTASPQR